jgi:hypothetical protein
MKQKMAEHELWLKSENQRKLKQQSLIDEEKN